jgi:hypothetical protein
MKLGIYKPVDDAYASVETAKENFNTFIFGLKGKRHAEFLAQGGCQSCHGHGVVLTWWTLDGSGYDERGDCPNPSCSAKLTGPDPTVPYPSSRMGVSTSNVGLLRGNEEQAEFERLYACVESAKVALDNASEDWTPRKGKMIEVIRTSKGADSGDKGIVFWEGMSYFRNVETHKIGFKTADGIVCWTTEKSCRVLSPEIKPQLDQAQKISARKIIEGKVKRESAKALLIAVAGKGEFWFPKSQVDKGNVEGTFTIPQWLADKNKI